MSNVFDLSGRVITQKPKSDLRFESCPVCGDIDFMVVVDKVKVLKRLICSDDECDGYIELEPVKK